MSNLDLENQIAIVEGKKTRLELFKNKMNAKSNNDKTFNNKLIEAGRKAKHLIYNSKSETFEFVEIAEGKNHEISIPSYHIANGINSCNLYLNNFIRQLSITINSLNGNNRRY